jgi:hypothetical protein
VWWYTCVIPALRRLRQEDGEVEATLDYTSKTLLKTIRYNNYFKM